LLGKRTGSYSLDIHAIFEVNARGSILDAGYSILDVGYSILDSSKADIKEAKLSKVGIWNLDFPNIENPTSRFKTVWLPS
jgi:hypothetical protein